MIETVYVAEEFFVKNPCCEAKAQLQRKFQKISIKP